jgi:hypothetical protein
MHYGQEFKIFLDKFTKKFIENESLAIIKIDQLSKPLQIKIHHSLTKLILELLLVSTLERD